jgi:hypothetical protein
MLNKFRFWLAWLLLPTEDKFRYHYYLMFWQEACFWSPKRWRKVHNRALIRTDVDFGKAIDMTKILNGQAQGRLDAVSKPSNLKA